MFDVLVLVCLEILGRVGCFGYVWAWRICSCVGSWFQNLGVLDALGRVGCFCWFGLGLFGNLG